MGIGRGKKEGGSWSGMLIGLSEEKVIERRIYAVGAAGGFER